VARPGLPKKWAPGTLLGRLSVFAGGWTLEAAESICCGEKIKASDVLDLLVQLVDKSLVMAENAEGGGTVPAPGDGTAVWL
jgi:predicted ATPase